MFREIALYTTPNKLYAGGELTLLLLGSSVGTETNSALNKCCCLTKEFGRENVLCNTPNSFCSMLDLSNGVRSYPV
jgi:hypothetical protein